MEGCIDVDATESLPAPLGLLELLPHDQPGVLDDDVETPEALERKLDRAAAAHLGLEVLHTGKASDLAGDRLGHGRIATRPVRIDSGVMHHERGAAARERARIGSAETAARPRDQHDAIVEADLRHAFTFSAAARPARRPKTVHSSKEFPIIRLRPCVPPAISPQAKTPSRVVSACSSITSPPFW